MASVLLISHLDNSGWARTLSDASPRLGNLKIIPERDVATELGRADHNLVIVDAGAVRESAGLVSWMRGQRSRLRIVVVTLAPTWQEARAVLLAGAIDYLSRALTKRELAVAIEKVFEISAAFLDD